MDRPTFPPCSLKSCIHGTYNLSADTLASSRRKIISSADLDLPSLRHCRHVAIVVTSPLSSRRHCRHVAIVDVTTVVTTTLSSCRHCRHVATVVTSPLSSPRHCRHVASIVTSPLSSRRLYRLLATVVTSSFLRVPRQVCRRQFGAID